MAVSVRATWSCCCLAKVLFQIVRYSTSTKLATRLLEIGSAEPVKVERYGAGQCFIHRTFAYRGIILCSWKAQIMDRDDRDSPKIETYYQVLIDERDKPLIKVQTDVGRFLEGNDRDMKRFRFGNTGVDQVAHNEIIPFLPTNKEPIQHKLFRQYFVVRKAKSNKFLTIVPTVALHNWKKIHLPWLYYTQIHKMVTDGIRLTAYSLYMGHKRVSHWWRYCIRIENLNQESVVLQEQRWGIYTGNGQLQTVRGIGILGGLPVLSVNIPAIQYCSHVSLLASTGHMWGYFLIKKHKAKHVFLCPVPVFSLKSMIHDKIKR